MKLRSTLALLIGLMTAAAAQARTIVLTDHDADQMAVIAAEAPRMSWAMGETSPGVYCNLFMLLTRTHSMLIRIPLDKIPKDARITKAEWLVPVAPPITPETRLYVWRLVADWGTGVCHQYRTVSPKPIEWADPGARGSSSDHATRPTAVVPIKTEGEQEINVTQDVELWHSGAAPNRGWIFTIEDDAQIRFTAPFYRADGFWKLRITYEPQ